MKLVWVWKRWTVVKSKPRLKRAVLMYLFFMMSPGFRVSPLKAMQAMSVHRLFDRGTQTVMFWMSVMFSGAQKSSCLSGPQTFPSPSHPCCR